MGRDVEDCGLGDQAEAEALRAYEASMRGASRFTSRAAADKTVSASARRAREQAAQRLLFTFTSPTPPPPRAETHRRARRRAREERAAPKAPTAEPRRTSGTEPKTRRA